jgi:hypothetical protein
MSSNTVGVIIVAIGLAIMILFALADIIGVGQTADEFGFIQIIGVGLGALVVIAGVAVYRRQEKV